MGGKSTLHKKHVSSDDVTTRDTFDLKSWQGLTSLLKAGKDALSPSAYGEFRNLVLQYTQQGGDPEFKRRIDEVVATFGQKDTVKLTPESVPSVPVVETPPADAPAIAKDVYTHSTRRVQPKFEISGSVPQAPTKPVAEQAVETIPEAPPFPEPVIDIPAPQPTPEVAPEPVADIPVSREPILPTKPIMGAFVPPKVDVPTPIAIPLQVNRSQPSLEEDHTIPPVPFVTLEQCKVRIAEIKRAVNSHYGNPVALMALPHNVGKTYMTALLTALKVSGSGTPGSVDFAMTELERAYNALLEVDVTPVPEPVIETIPKAPPLPEPVIDIPAPQPTPEVVPEPVADNPVSRESVLPTKPIMGAFVPPKVDVPEPQPVIETIPEAPPLPEPVIDIPASQPTPDVAPEPEHVTDVPRAQKHIAPPPLFTKMPVSVKTDEVQATHEVAPQTAQETSQGVVSNIPSSKNASRVLEELRATLNALEQKKASETNAPVSEQESLNETSPSPLRSEDLQSAKEQHDTIPDLAETVTDTDDILIPFLKESETDEGSENGNEPRVGSSPSVNQAGKIAPVTQEYIYRDNKYVNREIADTTTMKTLENQGIKVSEISTRQSELSSPQISTLLNTLLHEWSIFSGSGLFGTGPGGAEHPLYKVLAPLSMGEVVSGRWNRADPKVIKSITQYIDAWRHEQGITFSPSETFDHFLRRVVQRILKRQNL